MEDENIWQTLIYKPRKKNNKLLNIKNNNESNFKDSKLNINEENSGICLI